MNAHVGHLHTCYRVEEVVVLWMLSSCEDDDADVGDENAAW